MLEYPPHSTWPALRISCSPDRVESEANAKDSSDRPVSDTVTTKIQQHPSHEHGGYSGYGRVHRSRRNQGKTSPDEPANLYQISGNDRKPAKNLTPRRRIWRIHVLRNLVHDVIANSLVPVTLIERREVIS
jgi:hypothetical protein